MKAIEILNHFNQFCGVDIGKDITEAIKEIEDLQNEAGGYGIALSACSEKLEELQNKSCIDCNGFTHRGGIGMCPKGVSSDFKIGTFYCNQFEHKTKSYCEEEKS